MTPPSDRHSKTLPPPVDRSLKLQTVDSANNEVESISQKYLQSRALPRGYENLDTHEMSGKYKADLNLGQTRIKACLDNITLNDTPTAAIHSLSSLITTAKKTANLAIGIVTTEIPDGVAYVGNRRDKKVPVEIRDARLQDLLPQHIKGKFEDTPESYLMMAAAQARGAIKLIELSSEGDKEKAQKNILSVFKGYAEKIQKTSSSEQSDKLIKQMNYEIGHALQHHGLVVEGSKLVDLDKKALQKAMVDAKDLTNYEDTAHPATITISSNLVPGKKQTLNAITSFVPTICTQQHNYNRLSSQEWFQTLTPVQQALTRHYEEKRGKITDGLHMIPTQERNLPGLRNTGLECVGFYNGEEVTNEKPEFRVGAIAYNLGKGKELLVHAITTDNARLLGSLAPDKIINFIVVNQEEDIVKNTREVIEDIEDRHINKIGKEPHVLRFTHAPIGGMSLGTKKDKSYAVLDNAAEEAAKDPNMVIAASCASAKDRTAMAKTYLNFKKVDKYMEKIIGQPTKRDLEYAYRAIVSSRHNETISSNTQTGVGGLKVESVFGYKHMAGIKMDPIITRMSSSNPLRSVQDLFENKICDLNKASFAKPTDPVLLDLRAKKAVKGMVQYIQNTPSEGRGLTSKTKAAPKGKSR